MSTQPTLRPAAHAAAWAAVITAFVGATCFGPVPVSAQATPTAVPTSLPPSVCSAETRMWAEPEVVAAGADTQLSASLAFTCPGSELAIRHLIVVVDASSSMTGDPRTQLQRALGDLIDRLPLEEGRMKLGIVEYKAQANVLCALSASRSVLAFCITRIGSGGGSCIDCGLTAAHDELRSAREGISPAVELNESIILLTDGANADGCARLTTVAAQLKAEGIHISSIALAAAADVACTRAVATSPRHFFEVRQASQLRQVFDTIRRQLFNGNVQAVSLRFAPTNGLSFVPDSISFGGEIGADGAAAWTVWSVPAEGITVTLRLRPNVAGPLPALAEATGELVDQRNRVAPIAFDIPHIVALSGGALPTTTPAASSPVRTNGVTLSPPQPGQGERARLDYRFALDEPVDPQGSHVMLVADTSGSTAGEPLEALRTAVRGLVARLPLGEDPSLKIGIVTFTVGAKLLVGLTDDRAALESAVGRFMAAGNTCIDCGLRVGREALAAGRPAPGVEDLIVVTDGNNNAGCVPVIEEAKRVKAEGITLHTVCLGTGCDTACMRSAASPGHYLEARSIADLGATFAAIGDALLADRRFDAVTVRLAMPPHLRLVPDSFGIAPDAGSDVNDARWTFRLLPLGGIALSGEVEAIAAGDLSVVAVTEAVERGGGIVRLVAEAPRAAPSPVATPSLNAPTSTPSPEPTGTTERPGPDTRLYLPVAMRVQ